MNAGPTQRAMKNKIGIKIPQTSQARTGVTRSTTADSATTDRAMPGTNVTSQFRWFHLFLLLVKIASPSVWEIGSADCAKNNAREEKKEEKETHTDILVYYAVYKLHILELNR